MPDGASAARWSHSEGKAWDDLLALEGHGMTCWKQMGGGLVIGGSCPTSALHFCHALCEHSPVVEGGDGDSDMLEYLPLSAMALGQML